MPLSMPNYIPAMLSLLCPSGCGSASSPAIYTSPASHTDAPSPLSPTTTVSLPVSPAEKTWIQRVVGSLLFYARALDLSILTLSVNSPLTNPIPPNLTSPPLAASSTMSHPIPTPTKPFTPHPWLCGRAPTPATCLDLSRAVWLDARSDSENHPTTSSTRPQKVTDKAYERNSPLFVPPASSNHTLPTHCLPTHCLPPLPTMHPSTPSASAYS
jgi:hypothetical protein